jgi:hypothetical protein
MDRLNPADLGALWTLRKGDHEARADVRAIDGIGLELRYVWNGELRVSEMFRDWATLEAAAAEKRRELEARGWQAVEPPLPPKPKPAPPPPPPPRPLPPTTPPLLDPPPTDPTPDDTPI